MREGGGAWGGSGEGREGLFNAACIFNFYLCPIKENIKHFKYFLMLPVTFSIIACLNDIYLIYYSKILKVAQLLNQTDYNKVVKLFFVLLCTFSYPRSLFLGKIFICPCQPRSQTFRDPRLVIQSYFHDKL